jgi:chloramphenicol 3-O phosphotransferase
VASCAALYDAVAAHARRGLDVVVDVGHHDAYSRPLGILRTAAIQLDGLPALLVGVRCPLPIILERRRASGMLARAEGGAIPEPVVRWQEEVHRPGIYDLEVDTSELSADDAARIILDRLRDGPAGDALRRIRQLP